ncbi:MAG: TIGR01212 family radical SAM protein [Parasporobacterium sp.]|nr:TIGR01212 family radical SAM protein [Parasporobacterium sp.]
MKFSRYYSVNEHLREQFGKKIYKLALNGGTTCPNRDGTAGFGGCIFCGEGSGTFACSETDDAIKKLRNKVDTDRYIAYFQSFTSTYKMDDSIRRRMIAAASDDRIEIISIATRPDCLDESVMDFLKNLSEYKPLWVELGLQSMHKATADYINRSYSLDVFEEAVAKLRNIGADVIVHLILGLPTETEDDIIGTVRYINGIDIQGVKYQLLHIMEGTRLGQMYTAGSITWKENRIEYPYSLEEYTDIVCRCIAHTREDIVIHRITGDAPRRNLLAPLWSTDKKRVLNMIHKKLEDKDIRQGMMK